jgi:CheY-like chemotaxis protein
MSSPGILRSSSTASSSPFSFTGDEPIVISMAAPPRVLVVDDDEALRSVYSRVLTKEGYTVRMAASAEDALAYVKEERPDAILLDLRMPLINGVGFLYRLRQDPANQSIAVALITGETNLDEPTIGDLRTLSAQVWHKPLSLDDIRRVTRALLNPGASQS